MGNSKEGVVMGKAVRGVVSTFLFVVVVLLLTQQSHAFVSSVYSNHRAFQWNGWTYFPDVGISKYNGVNNVDNIRYDCEGRAISFEAKNSSGQTLFVETLRYEGDKVYNSDGSYLGMVYKGGTDPGTRAATQEDMKFQGRATVSMVKGRTSALLAPDFHEKTKAVTEMRDKMQTTAAVAMITEDASRPTASKVYEINTDGMRGMSAGEGQSRDGLGLGFWVNGTYGLIGNTSSSSKYDGQTALVMGGVDYVLTDRIVVGVGFGIEGAYMKTKFYGTKGDAGNVGLTIAPYLSIALMENLIFDMVGSVSMLNKGSTATAYNDAVRWMLSPNLTYYHLLNNWKFSGTLGLMYAREVGYHYTNSSNLWLVSTPKAKDWVLGGKPAAFETCELRAGGRVGYIFSFMEPYLGLAYLYDVAETQVDPDEVEGVIGVDFYPLHNFIVSLEAANSFFREDTYNARFMMNLRYEF